MTDDSNNLPYQATLQALNTFTGRNAALKMYQSAIGLALPRYAEDPKALKVIRNIAENLDYSFHEERLWDDNWNVNRQDALSACPVLLRLMQQLDPEQMQSLAGEEGRFEDAHKAVEGFLFVVTHLGRPTSEACKKACLPMVLREPEGLLRWKEAGLSYTNALLPTALVEDNRLEALMHYEGMEKDYLTVRHYEGEKKENNLCRVNMAYQKLTALFGLEQVPKLAEPINYQDMAFLPDGPMRRMMDGSDLVQTIKGKDHPTPLGQEILQAIFDHRKQSLDQPAAEEAPKPSEPVARDDCLYEAATLIVADMPGRKKNSLTWLMPPAFPGDEDASRFLRWTKLYQTQTAALPPEERTEAWKNFEAFFRHMPEETKSWLLTEEHDAQVPLLIRPVGGLFRAFEPAAQPTSDEIEVQKQYRKDLEHWGVPWDWHMRFALEYPEAYPLLHDQLSPVQVGGLALNDPDRLQAILAAQANLMEQQDEHGNKQVPILSPMPMLQRDLTERATRLKMRDPQIEMEEILLAPLADFKATLLALVDQAYVHPKPEETPAEKRYQEHLNGMLQCIQTPDRWKNLQRNQKRSGNESGMPGNRF